ncbi:MAG: hypothetical protein N3A54_06255 [Patescibacteria group bacterium]|nr:hypothetical protein [Patescibacteria group bacterium]
MDKERKETITKAWFSPLLVWNLSERPYTIISCFYDEDEGRMDKIFKIKNESDAKSVYLELNRISKFIPHYIEFHFSSGEIINGVFDVRFPILPINSNKIKKAVKKTIKAGFCPFFPEGIMIYDYSL